MDPSIEEIREILQIFLDSDLEDLRLEIGNVRLAVSKGGAAGFAGQPFTSPPPATPAPVAADEASAPSPAAVERPVEDPPLAPDNWVAVTAPSVGVFYRRPAPDQPPFVDEGSTVAADEPVCLIEIMKMFTSVAASCGGRVARILVEDAATVEFGQTLMYIEPA
jgi:acetyl-CoA carboxylase biotin carboxyl carrier protein